LLNVKVADTSSDPNSDWSTAYILLPFYEQQARFDAINADASAQVWVGIPSLEALISALLCPSDSNGRGLDCIKSVCGNMGSCR